MNNIKGDKKFLSMFLILVSLFVLIFFTKDLYSNMIYMGNNVDKKTDIYENKKIEEGELAKTKKDLEDSKGADSIEIQKYMQEVTEDEIIEELYSKANNIEYGQIKISSLTMSEGVKNELGFMEAKINITARCSSEESMKSFLDYLVDDSKYKFFITSFNLPEMAKGKARILGKEFTIQIPLTIFYVDKK